MTECFKANKEQGFWFEVVSTQRIIASKESKGIDASFERSLLKAWKKEVPEDYARAERLIKSHGFTVSGFGKPPQRKPSIATNQRETARTPQSKGIIQSAEKTAAVMLQKHAGGRPRKAGEVSRMTEWRRQQAVQGVLI